jgi:hypothetical protein
MSEANLTSLRADIDDLVQRLETLRRENDDRHLLTRPGAKCWSAAEVCEHLNITWGLYRQPLRAHAEQQREGGHTSSDGRVRPGWLAGKFIAFVNPSNTKKLKAPRSFSPSAGQAGVESIDSLIGHQAEILALLATASGLQLNRRKFPSPISALLRFTLGEGILLMVRHQQRHVAQAERAARAAADA